jgi:hypothetical protein
MPRPKVFTGSTIGIKLPALLDIRVRGEAAKSGKSISEIVRSSLERTHGGEHEASANKD